MSNEGASNVIYELRQAKQAKYDTKNANTTVVINLASQNR